MPMKNSEYRIKSYEELTIQDNFIFQKVMRRKRLCKRLIEKILHIKIRTITFPTMERSVDIRYDSKSIRLDVYVEDDKGRMYDIEMQCTSGLDGELAKRTRYYQGMIDMDVLKPGQLYDELNPQYIIFICTFDLFGLGLPMYTFRNRCIEEDGLELGDGTTKIFLNCKAGNTEGLDPDVAAFLRYVDGKAAEGRFVKAINDEVLRVKEHKETKVEYMTLAMELERMKRGGELIGEKRGIAKGKTIGREEGKLEDAREMLRDGLPIEKVAQYTKLSVEVIRKAMDGKQPAWPAGGKI